jgi:hypothetical protein
MTPSAHAVILFFTSNHAFRAEKLLAREGISCKLIPVPRHLSSDCGVCARIDGDHLDQARRVLEDSKVETQGYHTL